MNPRNTPEKHGRRLLAPTVLAAAAALCAVALLGSAAAVGELAQRGPLRVSVSGKIAPQALPRGGGAPVAVSVGGQISSSQTGGPPQLREIKVEINRHGRFTTAGLPRCRVGNINPSTSAGALEACGPALVGEGLFSADVKFPEQSPFPSEGKILAFNGRLNGKPAILAHIFGTEPAPTSYVMPFLIHSSKGTFGTVLTASLPKVTGEWGYVTGVDLTLQRSYAFRGERRSYLTADCPAPSGFRSAFFPLARTSFSFAGGVTLTSTLTRRCTVKG